MEQFSVIALLAITAPPLPLATLFSKIDPIITRLPLLSIAPPFVVARLFVKFDLMIIRLPPLSIAPPPYALLL